MELPTGPAWGGLTHAGGVLASSYGRFGARCVLFEQPARDEACGAALEDDELRDRSAHLPRELIREGARKIRVETGLHQWRVGVDPATRVECALRRGQDALHENSRVRGHS